jgi:hypothetical protein
MVTGHAEPHDKGIITAFGFFFNLTMFLLTLFSSEKKERSHSK